jgi:hypothetical protein
MSGGRRRKKLAMTSPRNLAWMSMLGSVSKAASPTAAAEAHCEKPPAPTTYAELGADFLERLEPQQLTRQLVKRLEALGHKVPLEPCPAA